MAVKTYKIKKESKIYQHFLAYQEDRKKLMAARKELTAKLGFMNCVFLGPWIEAIPKDQLNEESLKLYGNDLKTEHKQFKGYFKFRANSKLGKLIAEIHDKTGFKNIHFMMALFFDLAGRGTYNQQIITNKDVDEEEECIWIKIEIDGEVSQSLIKESIESVEEIKVYEWYKLKEKAEELQKNKKERLI